MSSKKFGFGINHLRNNNDETFWQYVASVKSEQFTESLDDHLPCSQIRRTAAALDRRSVSPQGLHFGKSAVSPHNV